MSQSTNRIKPLFERVGTKASSNMYLLLNTLSPGIIVPEPNKYYTFVYTAKTPKIRYDQHPFILCGSLFKWGFTGYNFHWGEVRRYNWADCSNLFEVYDNEVSDMEKFPIALFKST